MIDPSLAIQGAVYTALKAALPSVPVHDRVPEGQPYPYIYIGEDQVVDNSTSCHAGSEIFVTVNVWSDVPGRVECKQIAGQVRTALDAELSIDGHHLISHEFRDARYLTGQTPNTTLGVLTFRYLTEPDA